MRFEVDGLPAYSYTGPRPVAPDPQHAGGARKQADSGRTAS